MKYMTKGDFFHVVVPKLKLITHPLFNIDCVLRLIKCINNKYN